VCRFPGRDHFAAYNGTAPIEVSSGQRKIYRLSRRRNRRLNHAIHMAAITQIRYQHSQGRAHYDKKLAEGKTGKEALRALKRQVSNAIFACLQADARRAAARPGAREGNRGTTLQPARPAHTQAPALRASHSRTRSPPYGHARRPAAWSRPRPGHSWPFPGRSQTAVGGAEGPGGAPAAKRGRTTWRCGKTAATLGRGEGQRSRIAGKATAPEGHLTRRQKDRWNFLTQGGFDLKAAGKGVRLRGGKLPPHVVVYLVMALGCSPMRIMRRSLSG